MKNNRGFTLIELIIFIVIMGIIANIISMSYSTILRGTPNIAQQTNYSKTASQCMEWFLGQRSIYGFASSSLVAGSPTPNNAFCQTTAGTNLTTTISSATVSGDNNYKIINVNITKNSSTVANLSTMIANY